MILYKEDIDRGKTYLKQLQELICSIYEHNTGERRRWEEKIEELRKIIRSLGKDLPTSQSSFTWTK